MATLTESLLIAPLFALTAITGCVGTSPPVETTPLDLTGIERAEASVRPPEGDSEGFHPARGAAIVDAALVPEIELWDRLAEAAGADVLEEFVLERRLAREMDRRGLTITEAHIEREEANLAFMLGQAAGADDDSEVARLIESMREAGGLGPVRYESLLRRNAMLRRLVQAEVDIGPENVQRLYDVRHGPQVRARIIVVPNERQAAELRDKIAAAPDRSTAFARAAMEDSTDATGARGGLIEPFSTKDPAYPAPVRLALEGIEPGHLTPVIALDTGFAILLLEEVIQPEDPPAIEDVHDDLARELRLRRERLLMGAKAAELLGAGSITVIDSALGWSWSNRNETEP